MEIWQNHFLKKQFSSDQIWRKYLFFEKLWDICGKKTEEKVKKYHICLENLFDGWYIIASKQLKPFIYKQT